jgi:hypothetical protein
MEAKAHCGHPPKLSLLLEQVGGKATLIHSFNAAGDLHLLGGEVLVLNGVTGDLHNHFVSSLERDRSMQYKNLKIRTDCKLRLNKFYGRQKS